MKKKIIIGVSATVIVIAAIAAGVITEKRLRKMVILQIVMNLVMTT